MNENLHQHWCTVGDSAWSQKTLSIQKDFGHNQSGYSYSVPPKTKTKNRGRGDGARSIGVSVDLHESVRQRVIMFFSTHACVPLVCCKRASRVLLCRAVKEPVIQCVCKAAVSVSKSLKSRLLLPP